MNVRRMAAVLAVAVAAVLGQAGAAGAASGGQLRIEPGWYAGHHVSFLQPSVFSSKPNGGTFACFGLGPNLTGIDRPTAPLYVIVDPSATQDHCDGDPTACVTTTCSRWRRATAATQVHGRSCSWWRGRATRWTWPTTRSPTPRTSSKRWTAASWYSCRQALSRWSRR